MIVLQLQRNLQNTFPMIWRRPQTKNFPHCTSIGPSININGHLLGFLFNIFRVYFRSKRVIWKMTLYNNKNLINPPKMLQIIFLTHSRVNSHKSVTLRNPSHQNTFSTVQNHKSLQFYQPPIKHSSQPNPHAKY